MCLTVRSVSAYFAAVMSKSIIAWLSRNTNRLNDLEAGVTVLTAAATITAAQAKSNVHVTNVGAGAAVTYALPAAEVGMRVTAIVKAAQELRLDPNGTETIALPSTGVQGGAGKYLSADAVGESVVLVCTVAGTWDALGPVDGTWTAEL